MLEFPPQFVDKVRKGVPQLLEVDLQSNRLMALPDNLAELKTVRILKLKYNSFAAIPPVVLQMHKLQVRTYTNNLHLVFRPLYIHPLPRRTFEIDHPFSYTHAQRVPGTYSPPPL